MSVEKSRVWVGRRDRSQPFTTVLLCMHTLSRRPIKDFLQTGHFTKKRVIPPDATIFPEAFLPEGTAMPSHRVRGRPLPKGNPRPRFLNRTKIKTRRSHYWDLAIDDVNQRNEQRTWRVMRIADMLRQGWAPSSLRQAGYGEGSFWRAVHMFGRVA